MMYVKLTIVCSVLCLEALPFTSILNCTRQALLMISFVLQIHLIFFIQIAGHLEPESLSQSNISKEENQVKVNINSSFALQTS